MRRAKGELHRIDYSRWSVGTKVDPRRRVVSCPACKKPGAREVRVVYLRQQGKKTSVTRMQHRGPVVHAEALVEWLNPETSKYEVRTQPLKSCEAAELETS